MLEKNSREKEGGFAGEKLMRGFAGEKRREKEVGFAGEKLMKGFAGEELTRGHVFTFIVKQFFEF